MILGGSMCSVCMFLLGISMLNGPSWNTMALISVFVFIPVFTLSWGTITWLYVTEILNDKSISIGMLGMHVTNFILTATSQSVY